MIFAVLLLSLLTGCEVTTIESQNSSSAAPICSGAACAIDYRCTDPQDSLVTRPGDGAISLSWSSATADLGGYRIERALVGEEAWQLIGTTRSQQYIDATVVNLQPYRYQILAIGEGTAVNGCWRGNESAQPVPQPASDLGLSGSDGAVSLSWQSGSHAETTEILRRSRGEGAFTSLASVRGNSYLDTAVSNGTYYEYQLVSHNRLTHSAATPPQGITPLSAPAHLSHIIKEGGVVLFWSPVIGADHFIVERADSGLANWQTLGQVQDLRFADSALVNGHTYDYRVSAVSETGTRQGRSLTATPLANSQPQPPPESITANRVGMNLWFNTDWDGSNAFVDLMRHSRPWQDGDNWHQPVAATDALGWPMADASTVIYSGASDKVNGTYRLVFNGLAKVSIGWVSGSVTNQQYDPLTNTTTADVTIAKSDTGANSVLIVFKESQRDATMPLNSGFTNVRLYRPGYASDGSEIFTRPFLAALRGIDVLRLMDWSRASSNVVSRWADRVTPHHTTQGGIIAPDFVAADGTRYSNHHEGVAMEFQILLCNTLKVDCWINIPPVADDEYIQNLALLLRFGSDGTTPYTSPQEDPLFPPLDATLRLYLEYSNETWNSGNGYLAFHLIKAIVSHLPAEHPLFSPATDNIYTVVWRYPAWRITQIADIFRDIFGSDQMQERIRPLLMTQRGNANNTLRAALTWLDNYLQGETPPRSVNEVIFGAGGSAYYGVNYSLSADPDQFFASGNTPDSAAIRDFAIDTTLSYNYGVRHVAYEGGPGLNYTVGDNRRLNGDARMQTMVEEMHRVWSNLGGDLLTYYVLHGPSEWEFTADINDDQSAKLNALKQIRATPRAAVTLGPALPGRVVALGSDTTRITTASGYNLTIGGLPAAAHHEVGTYSALAAHAETAYTGTLTLTGYSFVDTRISVWINGRRQGEITLDGRSGERVLYPSSSLEVAVPAGVVVLRLQVEEGNMTLYAVDL
jgi:hypothetical protein